MIASSHILDSLPEYALGCLDSEETRLIEEHLHGCHLCRQELDEFQRVADGLALAAPDESPSAALKSRLIERISGTTRKRARPSTSRPVLRWGALSFGTAAGLLVIIALAISNLLLLQRLNHLEVITGPLGMRAITLDNTESASMASGFVVVSADGEDGVLVVDNLAMLDAQHEYQAWLERDGETIDAAVFDVDESGYRGMRLTAPDSLLSYEFLFVTVEPVGGSEVPTGLQVLRGSLFNR